MQHEGLALWVEDQGILVFFSGAGTGVSVFSAVIVEAEVVGGGARRRGGFQFGGGWGGI